MSKATSPKYVKEITSPESLFQREKEIEISGVRFRIRRMTLREELKWYRERDEILSNNGMNNEEKVVEIWEKLLQRVITSPKMKRYTEELPSVVIAKLIDEITHLHLWDMDFHTSRRG